MQWQITASRSSIIDDSPWLWSLWAAKAKGPLWRPCVLLFFALYAVGILGAALAGELPKFVRDVRWLAPLGLPALNALILSYAPQILDRLWDEFVPWLSNPDDEIAALREAAPRLLMRCFWPMAIFVTLLVGQYVVVNAPENWTQDYQNPQVLAAVTGIAALFDGYFIGGSAAMATIGLALLVRRMRQSLRFRRGFTFEGGKRALQPFNQLLWLIWGVMTPTLFVVLVANVALSKVALSNVVVTAVMALLTLGSVVVPQLFMNRLFRAAKERELQGLRDELGQVAALAEPAGADEGIRRLLRHQQLRFEFRQAEAFAPTLIDAGFAIQILLSVSATILANALLHAPLSRLLP
jgi:hypothetical protein